MGWKRKGGQKGRSQEFRQGRPPGLLYQRVLLEGEPKSELNLACGGFGGHPAGAGGCNVPIRCVEDGVVEGVEHVDSEVDELLFAELKHLVQRDVEQGYPVVP